MSMADHRLSVEVANIDHPMWCFRPMPGGGPDEHVGSIFYRIKGRGDFAPRDRTIVGQAFELVAPLVGGSLARFSEPSPKDLGRQTRRVLRCLLEGDGDKQIAVRMNLSRYTINQYTKLIYKHFNVKGRTELMARWIRRGWGTNFHWAE
jgi:DNA-binding NarL/FixJ family response regulator